MKIDGAKVNAILKSLNNGEIEGDWISIDGYNVWPAINVDGNFPMQVQNSGVFVKVFINKITGEFRTYSVLGLQVEEKKDD